MSDELRRLRSSLDRKKGQRERIVSDLKQAQADREKTEVLLNDLEDARLVLQTVAQMTQQELEYKISELVTLALEAVFPDPYQLDLSFELKRGKTEAVLSFVPNLPGDEREHVDPLDASGGGAVDVAALALRVSLWSLQNPKTRRTLILDEPLRFLSRDLQPKASAMLREISRRLNLQMIVVTHEPNLLEAADKVFEVNRSRKVSKITSLQTV